MAVTMKGVTRWRLLFSLVVLLQFCSGCGYFYYQAYYVPYEAYEARSDLGARALMYYETQILQMQEKLGNFEAGVWLEPDFWAGSSCFTAVLFLTDDSSINDQALEQVRLMGDSAVVISEDNGYIGSLLLAKQKHSGIYWSFESIDTLCIGRRDDKLIVTLFARLLDENGDVVESKSFEARLRRWEKRDWLGYR
jgi:hypothetical protein